MRDEYATDNALPVCDSEVAFGWRLTLREVFASWRFTPIFSDEFFLTGCASPLGHRRMDRFACCIRPAAAEHFERHPRSHAADCGALPGIRAVGWESRQFGCGTEMVVEIRRLGRCVM